jgi:dUTP pyrophosphatase
MNNVVIDVVKMYPDVEIPKYQTSGSAGCDVKAYLPKDKYPDGKLTVEPGETVLIPTGLKFSIPDGYEMQIRPRSGMSLKTKFRVANSPGTLDSDYRGELMIILENTDHTPNLNTLIVQKELNLGEHCITHGDRIAQLIIAPVVQACFTEKDSLDETDRGKGGFGSTGK